MRVDRVVRCRGYTRVSTERQAGEVQTSMTDQEQAINELGARLGAPVEAWYRDAGASGATVERRPDFRRLLADCEAEHRSARDPGWVLFYDDSRFGRFPDPDEAAALRFRFKQAGWIVRFAVGDETQHVAFRSVIRQLGSAQATEYRANIQRNARRGAKGTALQGFWTREAPFGYRRRVVYPPHADRVLEISVLKAPNEKVALTPEEGREAPIVRWMFEAYAAGQYSLGKLSDELCRRVPERRWCRTVVHHLLKNPVYVGDVLGGRRPADPAERLATPVRPASEWYEKRDAHPALISRELFAAVQARFEANRRIYRKPKSDYVLTGLVTCPTCGSPYVGGGGGRKQSDPTQSYRFYKCASGFRRGVVCPGALGTITRHLLDDAVIETLARELSRPAWRERIMREVTRALDARNQAVRSDATDLKRDLAQLERKRDRIVTLLADGTLIKEEAAPQLAAVRAEIDRLRTLADRARFAEAGARVSSAERDRLVQMAVDFPALAQKLEGRALRELVRPWIAAATFDKHTRILELAMARIPQSSVMLSGLPVPS